MWVILNAQVEIYFFQEVRVNQRVSFRFKDDPVTYVGKLVRKGEHNGMLIRLDSGGEIKVNTLELASAKILPETDSLFLFLEHEGQFFYP